MRTLLVTAVKIIAWLLVVGLTSEYVGSWLGALILFGVPVLFVVARLAARARQTEKVKAPSPASRTSTGATGAATGRPHCAACVGMGEPCSSCDEYLGYNVPSYGCISCGGRGRVACRYCHNGP
jgi:hypothetical protein